MTVIYSFIIIISIIYRRRGKIAAGRRAMCVEQAHREGGAFFVTGVTFAKVGGVPEQKP